MHGVEGGFHLVQFSLKFLRPSLECPD
jgi:hypothetical protein